MSFKRASFILDFLSPSRQIFTLSKSTEETLEKNCELYPKITMKTPEQRQWRRSSVFIVKLEHISHFSLVFLFLTLQVNVLWGLAVYNRKQKF